MNNDSYTEFIRLIRDLNFCLCLCSNLLLLVQTMQVQLSLYSGTESESDGLGKRRGKTQVINDSSVQCS